MLDSYTYMPPKRMSLTQCHVCMASSHLHAELDQVAGSGGRAEISTFAKMPLFWIALS